MGPFQMQVAQLGPSLVEITRVSPFSGKENTMRLPVSFDRIKAFAAGNTELIQRQFPELNGDQREFLQTGYTPEDWVAIFSSEYDGLGKGG